MWSAQYSQAHYGPAQYGPADIEEVEMMEVAPEIRYRQPSRPYIRTNPFKQHPAIKNDRIDDRIRELITRQQETGTGPQKQLPFKGTEGVAHISVI